MQTLHRAQKTQGKPDAANASACYPEIYLYDDRIEISAFATVKSDWEEKLLITCSTIKYLYEYDNRKNDPVVKSDNKDSNGSIITIATAGSNNKYRIGALIKLYSEWKRKFLNSEKYSYKNIFRETNATPGISFNLDTKATWEDTPALQINFTILDKAFIKYLTSNKGAIRRIHTFNMHVCLQNVVIKEVDEVKSTPKKSSSRRPHIGHAELLAASNIVCNAMKGTVPVKRNHNNVAEEIVGDDEKEFQDKNSQLELEFDTKKEVSIILENIKLTQHSYDEIKNILLSEGISVKEQTKTTLILN